MCYLDRFIYHILLGTVSIFQEIRIISVKIYSFTPDRIDWVLQVTLVPLRWFYRSFVFLSHAEELNLVVFVHARCN